MVFIGKDIFQKEMEVLQSFEGTVTNQGIKKCVPFSMMLPLLISAIKAIL